jgi:hypothetical protein
MTQHDATDGKVKTEGRGRSADKTGLLAIVRRRPYVGRMDMRTTGPRLRMHRGETLAALSVLVPVDLHTAAKTEAARRGISLTSMVREMLDREVASAKEVA